MQLLKIFAAFALLASNTLAQQITGNRVYDLSEADLAKGVTLQSYPEGNFVLTPKQVVTGPEGTPQLCFASKKGEVAGDDVCGPMTKGTVVPASGRKTRQLRGAANNGQAALTEADDLSRDLVATPSLLELVVGPINANILGIQLDITTITLNLIAAPAGGGGLLGGLLGGGGVLGDLLGGLSGLLSQLSLVAIVTGLLSSLGL